jgi:hypothetical protein
MISIGFVKIMRDSAVKAAYAEAKLFQPDGSAPVSAGVRMIEATLRLRQS